MIFFPGCLLAAAWSCANNSLSLNIFILLSASSHALWASDWWAHIEGYRRPYQFCSDVSSSIARQYFLAQRKMFTMIKKCKLKKQCETTRGFPLVTVLSPLHWTPSTNSRKRAGLWLRCEQAPPMWVWRHCLAASCQERKNAWQHWKRELIGLEAFWLIQPFGNCSWLRSLLRMFAAVLQWSSVILLCVLLKFKWIWSSLRLLCMPYINYMTIAVVNLSYLKHHVVGLNCRFPGVLEQ